MPGKVGNRRKPPAPCVVCAQKIKSDFMRTRQGDYHESCWWDKVNPVHHSKYSKSEEVSHGT